MPIFFKSHFTIIKIQEKLRKLQTIIDNYQQHANKLSGHLEEAIIQRENPKSEQLINTLVDALTGANESLLKFKKIIKRFEAQLSQAQLKEFDDLHRIASSPN